MTKKDISHRCHYSCFRQKLLEYAAGFQVNRVPEIEGLDCSRQQSGSLFEHGHNASWKEAVCSMKGSFNFFWVPVAGSIMFLL